MADMDSMEKSFERSVEQLTSKDIKEGDRIRITTKNGSEYEFVYTTGMLAVKGDGNALKGAFGAFRDVRVGERLDFGSHSTSKVESITHIRPSSKEAINLSPEASAALRVKLKLGMAGNKAIELSPEESRTLRELYGIAEFSPDQKP